MSPIEHKNIVDKIIKYIFLILVFSTIYLYINIDNK